MFFQEKCTLDITFCHSYFALCKEKCNFADENTLLSYLCWILFIGHISIWWNEQ